MDLTDPIGALLPSVDARVLRVLARAGLPLTGRDVARAAGASPEGARRVLLRLDREGLVVTRRTGSAITYEANRAHLLWPSVQALMREADQVVSSVKKLISTTIDGAAGADRSDRITAALFGSVARGESTTDSDIDVLLIVPDDLSAETADELVPAIIGTVESATGNECNVYATTRGGFDELMALEDPMIPSWRADAHVFHGPDFRRRLRGGPWDER